MAVNPPVESVTPTSTEVQNQCDEVGDCQQLGKYFNAEKLKTTAYL